MRGIETYRFAIIGLGGLFGLGIVASFAMTADIYLMKPVTQFVWQEQGTGSSCSATGTISSRPSAVTDHARGSA